MVLKIVIAVVALIAIPLIVALFVKKDYAVSREVTIRKPKLEVYNYLRFLKNQDAFSKWVMVDPGMKKDYQGTDGTIGFVYAWDGDKAGKGEQEIKGLSEGERVDLELRFVKPIASAGKAHFTTQTVSENETKVTWAMEASNTYPMNFMNLFMDRLLGGDLQVSLHNLKSILEKDQTKAPVAGK